MKFNTTKNNKIAYILFSESKNIYRWPLELDKRNETYIDAINGISMSLRSIQETWNRNSEIIIIFERINCKLDNIVNF